MFFRLVSISLRQLCIVRVVGYTRADYNFAVNKSWDACCPLIAPFFRPLLIAARVDPPVAPSSLRHSALLSWNADDRKDVRMWNLRCATIPPSRGGSKGEGRPQSNVWPHVPSKCSVKWLCCKNSSLWSWKCTDMFLYTIIVKLRFDNLFNNTKAVTVCSRIKRFLPRTCVPCTMLELDRLLQPYQLAFQDIYRLVKIGRHTLVLVTSIYFFSAFFSLFGCWYGLNAICCNRFKFGQ